MDSIWISVTNKKTFAFHSSEPVYNRLFDRWDSITKINAPNLSNLLPAINNKDVLAVAYLVSNLNNNKNFIINETCNIYV